VRVVWVGKVRIRGVFLLALIQHDVVALVNASASYAVAAQGSHDHFGVFVAGENC
jgi:hypothetical protein